MKDVLTAPFMVEMIRTATNMYAHGWDERNGGNISLMLEENEVKEYLDAEKVLRTIPTGFTAPELEGRYFLVTGTGKYFKNVQYAPAVNLSIVRLVNCARILDCSTVDLLLPRMTWSVPWNGEARLMRSRIRLV